MIPLSVFAALELEYKYPELPGVKTISTKSSLPEIIKYFLSFAILIAALASLVSLIYAGIRYLTSTGRPEAMGEAKTRLFNSFLGLAILLGSYLILVTVNPQLVIMRVERVPIEYGVTLFTEAGLNGKAINGAQPGLYDGATVEDLVKLGEARYLSYKMPDLREEFGRLVAFDWDKGTNPIKVNFENFPLPLPPEKSLGFLKETQNKVKITAFDKPNFKKEEYGAKEYTSEGWLDEDGLPFLDSSTTEPISGIVLVDFDFFESEVEFFDPKTAATTTGLILHPPLSLLRESIEPGVYLYSEKAGDQRHFTAPREDFRSRDIRFNNQAKKIEIKNEKSNGEYIRDYIAILHDDSDWSGDMRIFFEQRDVKRWKMVNGDIKEEEITGVGNIKPDTSPRLEFNDKWDRYGKTNKSSSIHVFKLSDDPLVCKYVQLCTEKEGFGKCIYYLSKETAEDFKAKLGEAEFKKRVEGEEYLPLPAYVPENIPPEVKIWKPGLTKYDEVEFDNKIKSIKIEESCLVALFDNFIKDLSECSKCDPYNPTTEESCNKCWDDNEVGAHSEVFTKSDIDLTDNEIHTCGWTQGIGFFEGKSCASAIAIYPIER